jgi:hypothetical protein
MGAALRTNTYHVGVIRGPLTRNLTRRFGDIQDEIMCAFEDVLSLKGTGAYARTIEPHLLLTCILPPEWNSVTAYSAMLDVVCRTSNRLFVGLPLCKFSSRELIWACVL